MPSPLFPASVVGSLPRPQFVRDLLERRRLGEIDDADYRKQMDAAVSFAIAMQESAGLDVISDGEWRRWSYIGVIAELCDGFEFDVRDGRSWHTVVRPLSAGHAGVIAEEVRFSKPRTTRQVKVCLPSPYLLGQRMWDSERSAKAYPTRRVFVEALVPFLRDELIRCREAGADLVQFDDPHICLFVDAAVQQQFDDWKSELSLGVDLLNQIVAGVAGVTIALHLCRRNRARQGWWGEGGYAPIMPWLNRLNVHQFTLEFTIPVAGDFAVLRDLPEHAQIGLGCVDVRSEKIDTPDEIAARVEQALQHVDASRLTLNPDCGFAPGSAAEIPLDEAYSKLTNEALAARMLRDRWASSG